MPTVFDIKLFDNKAKLSAIYTIVRISTGKGATPNINLYTDKGEVFELTGHFVCSLADHMARQEWIARR